MKNKMISFQDDLKERLKDPEFKKKWAESEVEYLLAKQLINARLTKQLSQRQLAVKVKTTQAVISRLETAAANPSLSLLKRLSFALDKKILIKLG